MSKLEQRAARNWESDLLQIRVHRGMNGKWEWDTAWRKGGEEAVDERLAYDMMDPPGYWRKAEKEMKAAATSNTTQRITGRQERPRASSETESEVYTTPKAQGDSRLRSSKRVKRKRAASDDECVSKRTRHAK